MRGKFWKQAGAEQKVIGTLSFAVDESEILSTLLISSTEYQVFDFVSPDFRRIGCDEHLILPFYFSKAAHHSAQLI